MSDHTPDVERRLADALDRIASDAHLTAPSTALARHRAGPDLTGADHEARRPWRRRLALAAAVLVLLVGAGVVVLAVRDREPSEPADPIPPSTSSSPFEVGRVPDGFRLVRADEATRPTTFGSDVEATDEAFTLLSPDGAVGPDVLAVSYLDADYLNAINVADRSDQRELIEVDGVPGSWDTGPDWSDLTLRITPDDPYGPSEVWVRVSSSTRRSREELVAIARATPVPDDPRVAPEMDPAPAGWTVVGGADAVLHASTYAHYGASDRDPLGPAGAHVQVFTGPAGARLAIRTMAPDAVDFEVVGRHPWLRPQAPKVTRVGGREIRTFETDCYDEGCTGIAATELPDRRGVVVLAAYGVEVEALRSIVTSVRPVSADRWNELRAELIGGRDLPPDPGEREVARGRFGDLDWMLQTSSDRDLEFDPGEEIAAFGIDRCLKVSDFDRWCVGDLIGVGGGPGETDAVWSLAFASDDRPPRVLGSLVVVPASVAGDATSIRISGPAIDSAPGEPARPAVDLTADLRPTPTGDGRFAVVPAYVGMAACRPPALTEHPWPWARIVLLDEAGRELDCVE